MTFYGHDHQVVDEVVRFVTDGIVRHGRAVVVATLAHRSAIVEALLERGLDPDEPPVAGRLVLVDARDTLGSFMTPTGPDPDRFMAHVGLTILDAGSDGAPVRVFGEMVALLWEDGDVKGAIALEELWSGFVERRGFDLLCAYPAEMVQTSSLAAVHGVCGQHSEVRAMAESATADDQDPSLSRVFLPVPEAVSSSRHFIVSSLGLLGADHLVQDAALIISELASNAVVHARSPFRVSVDESADVVRISVQDAGPGNAEPGRFDESDPALDGRGILIIEALARRWGCDILADGKVVWAELAA